MSLLSEGTLFVEAVGSRVSLFLDELNVVTSIETLSGKVSNWKKKRKETSNELLHSRYDLT
jgi:hypothetical protein